MKPEPYKIEASDEDDDSTAIVDSRNGHVATVASLALAKKIAALLNADHAEHAMDHEFFCKENERALQEEIQQLRLALDNCATLARAKRANPNRAGDWTDIERFCAVVGIVPTVLRTANVALSPPSALSDAVEAIGGIMHTLGMRRLLASADCADAETRALLATKIRPDYELEKIAIDAFEKGVNALGVYPGEIIEPIPRPSDERDVVQQVPPPVDPAAVEREVAIRAQSGPGLSTLRFEGVDWVEIGKACSAKRRSLWLRITMQPGEERAITYTGRTAKFELCAGREGDDAYVSVDTTNPQFEQLLDVMLTAQFATTT
jgi:hypothetical protein